MWTLPPWTLPLPELRAGTQALLPGPGSLLVMFGGDSS